MTTITTKQRNIFWLVIGGLVVLYYFPSVVMSFREASFARQQAAQQQAAQVAARKAAALPQAPPHAAAPSRSIDTFTAADPAAAFAKIPGIWTGHGTVPDRGLCDIRLEIPPIEQPGNYSGFLRLACMDIAFVGHGKVAPNALNPLLSKMNPSTAILTGTAAKGAIQFTVDRFMGPTTDGKPISAVELLPFGTDLVSLDWHNGEQPGGQMLLHKEKS